MAFPLSWRATLKNGRIDYSSCAHISVKQAKAFARGFAMNGDVFDAQSNEDYETAIVEYDKHPYVMLTPQVTYYRVRNPAVLDNRYLEALLTAPCCSKRFTCWPAFPGSTRAYLGITEQQRLPVILPPIAIQKKIAAVLSGLR